MDKKNTLIGLALLAAAFGLIILSPPRPPPPPAETPPDQVTPSDGATPADPQQAPGIPPPGATNATLPGPETVPSADTEQLVSTAGQRADQQIVSLANEWIEVHFTNVGGAIAEVAVKKYPEEKGSTKPYVINELRTEPVAALVGFPGADTGTRYELVSRTANSVVWRTTVGEQLEIVRTYTIHEYENGEDPYSIRHETLLRNLSGVPVTTPKLLFGLGTAQPASATDQGEYLNVGIYDGEDAEFFTRNDFVPGFFAKMFGADPTPKAELQRVASTVWASVKNQFFAIVVTPDQPGSGITAHRVTLPLFEGEEAARVGIRGRLQTDGFTIPANGSETIGFDVYAGPKEYHRLADLGKKQDLVMEFDLYWISSLVFAGFFAKLLITLLVWLESFIGNWGFAIIATTLLIRTLLWPITLSATRSAKRMQKIQGPLKEIQEKYKDDRRKQQEATLALFREHKVNPVGGCLPLLFQMPIFFGLFSMLRSASELRFAEFLWVSDLSAPDTVAVIPLPLLGHLPINIMPLLMGASMVVQMRMTPTPSTDNASVKMMKFMPYFITFICYTFSSGLALYWTASNLFSIFQQWVTNRRADPVIAAPAAAPAATAAKSLERKGTPHARKKKKKR